MNKKNQIGIQASSIVIDRVNTKTAEHSRHGVTGYMAIGFSPTARGSLTAM